MATLVGVGSSENTDSHAAGREAAQAALQSGGLQKCDLLLLFSTSKHDPHALHKGAREVVGAAARIAGGYAVGIITNQTLGYDGFQVGVAALQYDGQNQDELELFLAENIAGREAEVGADLAAQILTRHPHLSGDNQNETGEVASLLVLYDWINRTQGRLKLNMATPLLEGLSDLPSAFPLAGAGLVGDMQCRQTWQWFDNTITQQSAIAILARGDLQMESVVMHGCEPVGGYHRVTKAEGAVVLEIDERPASEVLAQMLGLESIEQWDEYRFYVTLGINKGDLWGDFHPDNYANRLCLSVDQKRGALVMFETGITAGTAVQLMRRSVDFDYMEQRVGEMLARLESAKRRPLLAFYIDCAGRASSYCGSETEDASEVQRALGEIPLLGIYSGIEIGRVAGDWQALEWSGVLCILSEAQGN